MTDKAKRTFVASPAKRQNIIPLIGVYGKSGSGKTRSALILARGMVGPKGKIRLIDTENKRGHLFAEKIPGGYEVVDLAPPFDPESYLDALIFASVGADIVVADSTSHEWEGEGGVLEMHEAELDRMAGNDWGKRSACTMAAWLKPKFLHKRFVQKILTLTVPVICCLRAQEKTRMGKDERGKTTVKTDEFTSPIADPRFIFEMLVNLEMYEKEGNGGFCHIRKISNEDLFACLPKENEQITYAHGERLMAWCKNPDGAQSATGQPAQATKSERSKLLTELRDSTTTIHGWKKADGPDAWPAAKQKLQMWLADECAIDKLIDAQTDEELKSTIAAVKAKINLGGLL